MKQLFAIATTAALFAVAAQAGDYVPPKGSWQTHTPQEEGLDPAKLQAAIDFAIGNEPKFPPDLAKGRRRSRYAHRDPAAMVGPLSDPIGPLKPHAPANGIILRHGYIVAEWGDTSAVDMTHSVTKTFLSAVAGIAFDRRLIRDVNDRVIDYVQPSPDFSDPHNLPITWDEMLRQTSGWIGTMWGKPWWADRPGKNPWDRTCCRTAACRYAMEIFRRARQRVRPGADLPVEEAAAGGAAREHDESDRRLEQMALGRL